MSGLIYRLINRVLVRAARRMTKTPTEEEDASGSFADGEIAGMRRALAIARGCEDYGGGYLERRDLLDAYHHGMETVATVIKSRLDDPTDFQARVVEGTGRAMKKEVSGE